MRRGMIGGILMGLPLLLVGCGIAIEWGPVTPEPAGPRYDFELQCPNCYLPKMGYAPLLVKAVVKADPEEYDPDVTVVYDWGDGTAEELARLNQEVRHVYEKPGLYGVSVRAGEQLWGVTIAVNPAPEETGVLTEPWRQGSRGFCEARRILLGDPDRISPGPGETIELPYILEIRQLKENLEAIKVDDRSPYPTKYEPVYYWITPSPGLHRVENALRFAEAPEGRLWITEVQCISQADEKGLGGGIADVIELRMNL